MTSYVLIVDDEINVLKSLRRALRSEPYTVITAQSAEEGMAVLETTCCKVVVSDEKMPEMSGTAFLALVKERYPQTVRIMLTGHATLDAAMKAVNEGEIYRFFSKPWDDLAVRYAIRSGVEKYDLEVRTNALLSAMPDAMFRYHRDGTCLDYHPFSSGPEFPPELFLGRSISEALPPELAETALRHIGEVFDTAAMRVFEFSYSSAGKLGYYEARIVLSGPNEVLVIVRDTTLRKESVAALKEKQEELKALNATLEARVQEEVAKNREKDRVLAHQARQAALGEMVGSIAHQWRQPLTAASSLVQNIKALSGAGLLTPELLSETVDAAQHQIRYMSDTIDELRTFFRPDKEMESFELTGIVEQAVRIVAPQLESHGITARVGFDAAADHPVHGFPNELKQVIVNLLNNAWQAIEERRSRGEDEAAHPWIEVTVEREGETLRTTISDSGCGIAPELRERLFEPYFTTRADRGGSGIGLYMSKMIIESSMGGRLYLKDGAAATSFVIELSGGGK